MIEKFWEGLDVRAIHKSSVSSTNGATQEESPEELAYRLLRWERDERTIPYTGYLRSSTLADVCLREQLLGYFEGIETKEKHPNGLLATFEIGHAVHFWLQNRDHFFGEKILGWWECQACGFRFFGRRPLVKCEKCSARPQAFRYEEHSIKISHPYRATGHVDLFIGLPGELPLVCDIKTMDGKRFSELTEPLYSHVVQVTDYLILLDYDSVLPISINTAQALVLYIPKGHQARSFPGKAFRVQRRPEVESWIRSLRTRFTEAVANRTIPEPLEECELMNFEGTRAQRCVLKSLCRERASRGL